MQQRIAALERDLLAAAQQQAQQARQMGLLRQQHQEELLSLQVCVWSATQCWQAIQRTQQAARCNAGPTTC
jgi:hypothetical protein